MRDDLNTPKAFLDVVKTCLADDLWQIWTTRKNNTFLTSHGLGRADVKDEIEKLLPGHAVQGPMDDDSMSRPPGTIYVFKKFFQHERETIELYIKIEILDYDTECEVMSFHESDLM